MSPQRKQKNEATIDDMLAKGMLAKGSDAQFTVEWVPFGIPDLDTVTGGGVPRNRISLLTGEYSGGKSFLVQILMKQSLEADLQVAYLDTERSFDPIWWSQVGIDVDKVLVSQPATAEQTIDVAVALAKSGVDVIAVDSLAGMVPKELTEADAEQKFIGLHARAVNRFMQSLLGVKHRSAIVCTNQLRSHLGPGPIDTMPGGWGQLFYAGLLLRIQREGWIEEEGRRVGFNIKVVCRKSKVGTPFRECILPFHFRGEIDILALLMERGIEAGCISQNGPWYSVLAGTRVMGRNSVLEMLRSDEALRQRLEVALGDYEQQEETA